MGLHVGQKCQENRPKSPIWQSAFALLGSTDHRLRRQVCETHAFCGKSVSNY